MTLAIQLFKNSINTQEKLRLNLHSLSVSELLEYGRTTCNENNRLFPNCLSAQQNNIELKQTTFLSTRTTKNCYNCKEAKHFKNLIFC